MNKRKLTFKADRPDFNLSLSALCASGCSCIVRIKILIYHGSCEK